MESLAYQTKDILMAMQQDSGIHLKSLKADGGATANSFLMQFQADILEVPVNCPETIETTALGAAYLAGLAVGFWDSKETIAKKWRSQRLYLPNMNHMKAQELYDGWQKAVQACMSYSVGQ